MRRSTVLVIGMLLYAHGGGAVADSGGGGGMSLSGSFMAFHPQSPWNTPIPEDASTDPFSNAIIMKLKKSAGRLKADHAKWSIPLFVVDAEKTPKVTVWFSKKPNPLLDSGGRGFVEGLPVPDQAWPDPKDDGHMLLIDPNLMISWDFSKAHRGADRRWRASRIDIWDLKGMGVRQPFKGSAWWTYGARGSGFPLIAGLIRPEEIEAGEIKHALVFASPLTRKSSIIGQKAALCPPASRSDGTKHGMDTIPMGARMQLDPALDLDSLNLSRQVRVIARAMQRFGMYNGDTTHDVFKIYLQNLGADGGAWAAMDLSGLGRIPIDRFRVLSCDLVIQK